MEDVYPPAPLANDLWSLTFPLRFFGMQLGRRVTIIRLSDERLVLHSTGPFEAGQVEAIKSLGRPGLMLEATTMHDTFSKEARKAFPDLPYLVPEGFAPRAAGAEARPIGQLDSLTGGELQVIYLDGMRFLNEAAVFHPASRTLILGDLLFNLVDATGYTRWVMRTILGVDRWPAIDRPMRLAIRDRQAFLDSIQGILSWDFDRIVVAHGAVVARDGKAALRDALDRAGFPLEAK